VKQNKTKRSKFRTKQPQENRGRVAPVVCK